jgi:hypothetical protein
MDLTSQPTQAGRSSDRGCPSARARSRTAAGGSRGTKTAAGSGRARPGPRVVPTGLWRRKAPGPLTGQGTVPLLPWAHTGAVSRGRRHGGGVTGRCGHRRPCATPPVTPPSHRTRQWGPQPGRETRAGLVAPACLRPAAPAPRRAMPGYPRTRASGRPRRACAGSIPGGGTAPGQVSLARRGVRPFLWRGRISDDPARSAETAMDFFTDRRLPGQGLGARPVARGPNRAGRSGASTQTSGGAGGLPPPARAH